ncbi:MAG: radical SAM protein, partial [Planctomycetes bacterium]|nr:radical SAM protein [Planctomycetota bacterium]
MSSRADNIQSYVFGPVPSRRLGRSLGVDLVPYKTCSYDCVYCQIGRTTDKTTRLQSWAEIDEIVKQIKANLYLEPDFITLSGSGEPTLYAQIGSLIQRIKKITDVQVAVITNGSLLSLSEVRASIGAADLVIPSLDAGCSETFQIINRPCPDISFERMLGGLIEFRRQFTGQYWLEVFILAGINDSETEIGKLAECIRQIAPDKVQLNTVSRPPAEEFANSVDKETLTAIAKRLAENAEVIADFGVNPRAPEFRAQVENVLEMLKRRPCSSEDISAGLGI